VSRRGCCLHPLSIESAVRTVKDSSSLFADGDYVGYHILAKLCNLNCQAACLAELMAGKVQERII
jgi:hypothetical protein